MVKPIVLSRNCFGSVAKGEIIPVVFWNDDKSRRRIASLSITTSNRPSVGGIGGATLGESSSSSCKERSKFPEGLKETEANTCRRCREEAEIGQEGEETEMGLQNLHEMGERDG